VRATAQAPRSTVGTERRSILGKLAHDGVGPLAIDAGSAGIGVRPPERIRVFDPYRAR
jgi:hypothetical protein